MSTNKTGVAALIATADRGPSIVMTIESIKRLQGQLDELVIVDQSSNDDTYMAIMPYLQDPFISYMRVSSKGKGKALNLALAQMDSEIVILTDDDTEVCDNWVTAYTKRFTKDDNTVLIYGDVLAADFDPTEGFIPVYECGQDRVITSLWERRNTRGIGANCAIRRSPVMALGGFDPEMGPGGDFRACIDYDLTVRCIVAGHTVQETPASAVIHYGFRTHKQGARLMRNAFHGIAAMHTKLIRAGHYNDIPCMIHEFACYAAAPLFQNLMKGKLQGLQAIKGLASGITAALRHDFDATTAMFQPNLATSGSIIPMPAFGVARNPSFATAQNPVLTVVDGGLQDGMATATNETATFAVSSNQPTNVDVQESVQLAA